MIHLWARFRLILLTLVISLPVLAAENPKEPINEKEPFPTKVDVSGKPGHHLPGPTPGPFPTEPTTRELRESARSFFLVDYSLFDLLVLGKYGATAGYVASASRTWEVEYLHGSYTAHAIIEDLGNMIDNRVSLTTRSYLGDSFNVSYGLTYFDFYVGLGEQFLKDLSPAVRPAADHLEVESLGFNFGVGNRWQLSRKITFGVDWLTWSQPLFLLRKQTGFLDYVTNDLDRGAIDKAVSTISYFPRFTVLKLQLGVQF